MDVGLGGNIFTKNFNSLGFLAEHNWFKHLWQLCFLYKCDLTLDFPDNPQRARVGDSPLMDILVSSKLYTTSELGDLQRVRRFKCVHFLSDVLCADGCTVRPDMLTNQTVSSSRAFSLERPTKNDFDLWRHALRQLSSSQFTLERGLGDYLIQPHNHDGWFCSPDKSTLYQESESGSISVYELPRGS